jgi:hypothetical protein
VNGWNRPGHDRMVGLLAEQRPPARLEILLADGAAMTPDAIDAVVARASGATAPPPLSADLVI